MNRTVGILVGGGPAPGINGVISAVVTEAQNRGYPVVGIRDGFERLIRREPTCAVPLSFSDVATIHREGGSILGTSRANPTKSPELLQAVVETLESFNIRYLVTIGGDDTATSAQAVARAANGKIAVGHVPKTIDNDLPLPERFNTFGFQSAREVGAEITETLMTDARATSRWYLVIAMGRKAGHLALGIGTSTGATLTLIPEEFGPEPIALSTLVDIIVGSILKNLARGVPYGVCVLAEGLAEKLDKRSIPELENAEKDPHGHIRYAELDFAVLLKRAVRTRLAEFGLKKLLVVEKNVGYELRCRPPNSFDREYTRLLGYGVIDFLLSGGTGAMISRQGDALVPIPFAKIIDSATGKTKVRFVDLDSVVYTVARKYMVRLTEKNLSELSFVEKLSELTGMPAERLQRELAVAAAYEGQRRGA